MTQELELKFSIPSAAADAVCYWLEDLAQSTAEDTRTLVNTYYDTPDCDLSQRHIALRIRQADDRHIQTLKTQGEFVDGAHKRQEWEWPLMGRDLNIGVLADTPVGENINLAELKPVFETNFRRRIFMLDDGQAKIECVIDEGEIRAGDDTSPLTEVELELKDGDASKLTYWAQKLADAVPVFLNLISKAEQGYHLAGLHQPVALEDNIDARTRFLHGLSVFWLTGQDSGEIREARDSVRETLEAPGLESARDLVEQILSGDMADRRTESLARLGPLQLALIS